MSETVELTEEEIATISKKAFLKGAAAEFAINDFSEEQVKEAMEKIEKVYDSYVEKTAAVYETLTSGGDEPAAE